MGDSQADPPAGVTLTYDGLRAGVVGLEPSWGRIHRYDEEFKLVFGAVWGVACVFGIAQYVGSLSGLVGALITVMGVWFVATTVPAQLGRTEQTLKLSATGLALGDAQWALAELAEPMAERRGFALVDKAGKRVAHIEAHNPLRAYLYAAVAARIGAVNAPPSEEQEDSARKMATLRRSVVE